MIMIQAARPRDASVLQDYLAFALPWVGIPQDGHAHRLLLAQVVALARYEWCEGDDVKS